MVFAIWGLCWYYFVFGTFSLRFGSRLRGEPAPASVFATATLLLCGLLQVCLVAHVRADRLLSHMLSPLVRSYETCFDIFSFSFWVQICLTSRCSQKRWSVRQREKLETGMKYTEVEVGMLHHSSPIDAYRCSRFRWYPFVFVFSSKPSTLRSRHGKESKKHSGLDFLQLSEDFVTVPLPLTAIELLVSIRTWETVKCQKCQLRSLGLRYATSFCWPGGEPSGACVQLCKAIQWVFLRKTTVELALFHCRTLGRWIFRRSGQSSCYWRCYWGVLVSAMSILAPIRVQKQAIRTKFLHGTWEIPFWDEYPDFAKL